jgi:hypothetical protein
MNRHIRWITEGSQRLLLVDCAGKKEPDMLAAMDEYQQELLSLPPNTKLLVLMDMSRTAPYPSVNAKGREMTAAAKARGIPDYPTAIVGFTSVQKGIAQMFITLQRNSNLHLADTLEAGKAWLLKRALA